MCEHGLIPNSIFPKINYFMDSVLKHVFYFHRYPSISQTEELLGESGLVVGPSISLTNEVFFKREQWQNVEGPLHKAWRNSARLLLPATLL